MSWLWRGFQSAVFYYLSCAPCTTFAHQRKRQKANRKARAEKSATENTDTGVYHHPSPFDTNVYWQEEILLGPGPSLKRGTKERGKSESTKRLNTNGPGSSAGTSSADTTMVESSTVEVHDRRSTEEGAEGWNCRRYQRPDEVLWGFEDQASAAGESIGMSVNGQRSVRSIGTYYTARNPAVNDLHPPVVSTPPTSKNETRWMLQPPPSAKVMAGKVPASTRSRSTTTSTSGHSSHHQTAPQAHAPVTPVPTQSGPARNMESRSLKKPTQDEHNADEHEVDNEGSSNPLRDSTTLNQIDATKHHSSTSNKPDKYQPPLSSIDSYAPLAEPSSFKQHP